MNKKQILSAVLAGVIMSSALVSCSEKTVDTDNENVGAVDGGNGTEVEETETEKHIRTTCRMG